MELLDAAANMVPDNPDGFIVTFILGFRQRAKLL